MTKNERRGQERVVSSTKKIALTGLLTAAALALSFFESLLPAFSFLPPGAKLGLSNIVIMLALSLLGLPYAFGITLVKIGFTGLIRGASAFFISAAGGMLALLVLFALTRFSKGKFGAAGVSVGSAVAHNAGQLLAACVLTKSLLFMAYAPLMLAAGVAAGVITGAVYWLIFPFAVNVFKK